MGMHIVSDVMRYRGDKHGDGRHSGLDAMDDRYRRDDDDDAYYVE